MYNLGGVSQEAASYMQRDKAPFRKQEIQAEGEKLEASRLEKTLTEADKAIAEAEVLIDEYGSVQPEETEDISQEVSRKQITLSSRGDNIKRGSDLEVSQFNLSDEEFYLMAQVVQAEAGGEPYEGQVAVANVILNRVKAGWGETVTEVINQKGQFTKKRKEPSDSVIRAVKEALSGKNAVPEGTLYFLNLDICKHSSVSSKKEYVTKIGGHTFFR